MKPCPVCADSKLQRIRYENIGIEMCPSCAGALVSRRDAKAIERKMEIDETQLERHAASAGPDSSRVLHCPRCLADMDKVWALDDIPPGFKSPTIGEFYVDHCKRCELTWFDGGELAKFQLSYQRSAKGQENKKTYVNYNDLNSAERAEYRRTLAASACNSGDAYAHGLTEAIDEISRRVNRRSC